MNGEGQTSSQWVGVFVKYWTPGHVKTRLGQSLGNDRASRLYREFVAQFARRLSTLGQQRIAVVWPPQRGREIAELCGPQWQVAAQRGPNLGERMHSFFADAFAHGASRVVLLGSDSPTLPTELVVRAFELLEQTQTVLGPTEDGGYYLVGSRETPPPIFESIAWSQPTVWADTIARLERAGRSFATLPMWYDVDDVSDLWKLQSELQDLIRDDPSWLVLRDAVEEALSGMPHP